MPVLTVKSALAVSEYRSSFTSHTVRRESGRVRKSDYKRGGATGGRASARENDLDRPGRAQRAERARDLLGPRALIKNIKIQKI